MILRQYIMHYKKDMNSFFLHLIIRRVYIFLLLERVYARRSQGALSRIGSLRAHTFDASLYITLVAHLQIFSWDVKSLTPAS